MKYFLTLAISLLSQVVFSQTVLGTGTGDSFELALANALFNFDEQANEKLSENHQERINNISYNNTGVKTIGAFSISFASMTTISVEESRNGSPKELTSTQVLVLQYSKGEAKWVYKAGIESTKREGTIKSDDSIESKSINFNRSLLKDEFTQEGYYLFHTIKSEKYDNGLSYFIHQVEVSKTF